MKALYFRGALKFSEVMEAATSKRRTELLDLQSKLQFDDPINIQFTSVSNTHRTIHK